VGSHAFKAEVCELSEDKLALPPDEKKRGVVKIGKKARLKRLLLVVRRKKSTEDDAEVRCGGRASESVLGTFIEMQGELWECERGKLGGKKVACV